MEVTDVTNAPAYNISELLRVQKGFWVQAPTYFELKDCEKKIAAGTIKLFTSVIHVLA